MTRTYVVDPQIRGDVRITSDGAGSRVYLGRLAESGPPRKILFGGEREFVALIVGKRGSGKSHTLGSILEGYATKSDRTSISEHSGRPACLLIDPMGNFWTTAIKVSENGPPKVKSQWEDLQGWGCLPEDINVEVWMPDGFSRPTDPSIIRAFRIRVSDLGVDEIADLLGVNLLRDPQGAALSEAFQAVTEDGWNDGASSHPPLSEYGFHNLIEYLEFERARDGSDHASSVLRSLVRSLRSLNRQPVFSGTGTPLTDLLREGHLSILMLPNRVGADLRKVVTRVLIRRILREREIASQIRQRLDIEQLSAEERVVLELEIRKRIPRSLVALDEAQELLGDDGGEARQALENFCLLGRNYGLSLILATQRPMASAISAKVRSQVDTYIIHRLLTTEDIEVTQRNLLSLYPKEVTDGYEPMDFQHLVRSLDRGQAIVSSSYSFAEEEIKRLLIAKVRPRITVHGGEVE